MRHDAIDTCRPTPVGERRAAMNPSQVMVRAWRTALGRAVCCGLVLH
ncbi:MAG: hypothetical protein ACJ8GO_18125 [Ramlibacter sp.]